MLFPRLTEIWCICCATEKTRHGCRKTTPIIPMLRQNSTVCCPSPWDTPNSRCAVIPTAPITPWETCFRGEMFSPSTPPKIRKLGSITRINTGLSGNFQRKIFDKKQHILAIHSKNDGGAPRFKILFCIDSETFYCAF